MSQPAPPTASPMQQPATWDSVATGYAEQVGYFTSYAEEALRVAAVRKSDRVLDVGAGPGTLALLAAPRVTHVTAVDFSPGMIEQLRARAAREAVDNVDAQTMDAQSLAFGNGSFDVVFSLFAFMFIPDRARAFRELRRVLGRGGRVVIATWGPIERRPLMKLGFDALAEVMPELPAPTKGDLQQTEACVREMSAAGFLDVDARAFTASVHFDSPDAYAAMMLRTSPTFAAVQRRLREPAWTVLVERLRDAIRRRIPDTGIDLPAEAMLTSGTR